MKFLYLTKSMNQWNKIFYKTCPNFTREKTIIKWINKRNITNQTLIPTGTQSLTKTRIQSRIQTQTPVFLFDSRLFISQFHTQKNNEYEGKETKSMIIENIHKEKENEKGKEEEKEEEENEKKVKEKEEEENEKKEKEKEVEDENEYEYEDDKYIKSFYEIYNDDKDTYDCPYELLRFIKKEHINVELKIKCSSPRNLKKKDVENVIVDMFKSSENVETNNEKKQEKNDNRVNRDEADNVDNVGNADNNGSEKFKEENVYFMKSRFKEFDYPEKNVMWPNPFVYNHRLQPFILKKEINGSNESFEKNKQIIEANKNRLENLWNYSSSYGICWDWLDELFLNYQKKRTEHLNEWENNKTQIMLYASKVCKRKLIKSRKELLDKLHIDYSNNIYKNYDENENMNSINLEEDDQTEYNLLLPRSIFRKWTRTLYFYWKDRYMHYYNNTLHDYLKGEIVDKQLLREHNERNLNLKNKKMLENHSYDLRKVKGSNLYITRFIKNKNKKQENENEKSKEYEFDFTGIEQSIYDTTTEKRN